MVVVNQVTSVLVLGLEVWDTGGWGYMVDVWIKLRLC